MRDSTECGHKRVEARKSLVASKSPDITSVDLLRDDGDLESAEDIVEKHVRRLFIEVHFHQFSSRNIFHQDARVERHTEHLFACVARHPVTERRTEIHQRITDGYHFPIEHRRYSRE